MKNNLRILIDGINVEIGSLSDTGISMSYGLEDPENFENKQSSMVLGINVPATPANDRLFNHFRNPKVEDTSADERYTNPRRCSIYAGGIEILKGVAMLQGATQGRLPGSYSINCYGQNGDWVIEMKDLSLWNCLSSTTHIFDVATVEGSWFDYGMDEAHDYVYAPVRYRQPFGTNDNAVNIFHLRPSLSIYWMIIRAFRQYGYRVESNFLNTTFFKRLVMPWVWGSFYDIDGSAKQGIQFKASGPADESSITSPTNVLIYEGSFSGYLFTYTDSFGVLNRFRLNNVAPPHGYDDFGLYSFTEGSGTMAWTYNPPPATAAFIGNNISANFRLKLLAKTQTESGHSVRVRIEVTHVHYSGAPDTVTVLDYDALDLPGGGTKDRLMDGAVHIFTVGGIYLNDVIKVRVKVDSDGHPLNWFEVHSSKRVNLNPGGGEPVWGYLFSTFELTSLQLELGGTVNFKFYDRFKSVKFLDMLRGLIDAFNLSVQTNPIDKVVTIEPTTEYLLPVSGLTNGYFKAQRLDWTNKVDVSKESELSLFSDTERQLDFQYKPDGNDGGQNIYAGRYRGIYLNNTINNPINNTNTDNGIVAGVPGSARYMFPLRFRKGAKAITNRFFAATMHYKHQAWKNITGTGSPAPQLIAIFPDNINDSSASAVTQTFEPRLCYYKGTNVPAVSGGWRWIGDPAAPYGEVTATGFGLPEMFSVNYGPGGENDPVLSYSDEMINGVRVPGLLRRFFLKRMAIMRTGKLLRTWIRLDAGDMTNWTHRERIILDGALYYLIGIEQYNPLSDSSAKCVLWKVAEPEQRDVDAVYPSADALSGTSMLSQFDIKYAPLLLLNTDIPQL